jgi:hypothetical protein
MAPLPLFGVWPPTADSMQVLAGSLQHFRHWHAERAGEALLPPKGSEQRVLESIGRSTRFTRSSDVQPQDFQRTHPDGADSQELFGTKGVTR